jgi:hypothetical protein
VQHAFNMFTKQEIPSLTDHNSNMKGFVEALSAQLDYFNDFITHFKKEFVNERTEDEESRFIHDLCIPLRDYLDAFDMSIEIMIWSHVKKGSDRGKTQKEVSASSIGKMQKKYKQVYENIPEIYRVTSGLKGFRKLIRDPEAMKHLHKI